MIHPKIQNGALAGAVTVLLLYVLGLYHVTIPDAVASAFTTVVTFATGYITPSE